MYSCYKELYSSRFTFWLIRNQNTNGEKYYFNPCLSETLWILSTVYEIFKKNVSPENKGVTEADFKSSFC